MPTKERPHAPPKLSLVRERLRKTDRLLEMIRGLAVEEQQERPQIFLSLRAAARHFGVPTSAMAAVYKQLTEEGILSGIRGSHTILEGRAAIRNLKVRGLIGMPISISRFQALQDYRCCFLQLRDKLHERGFVISPMFFEQPEGEPEVIIKRLRKEKVDAVIWLLPDEADRGTALRLRDMGIGFIGINITPVSGMICRYQVRRQQAIRTIMRSWRADLQKTEVTIVRVPLETTSDEKRLTNLRTLIESERIQCAIETVPDVNIGKFLKSLCQNRASGIILPAPAATMLGWRAPETLTDVLENCRCALIDGPMDLPFAERLPKTEVDVVTVRWSPVAKQIASDMVTGQALNGTEPTVFEADARLRVPFRRYAGRA
jgi:hypothetical protein